MEQYPLMEHMLIFSKIIGNLWNKQIRSDAGLYEGIMVQWSVHYLLVGFFFFLKKFKLVMLVTDFTGDSWSYEVISVKWTAMQIGLNITTALRMISMFV